MKSCDVINVNITWQVYLTSLHSQTHCKHALILHSLITKDRGLNPAISNFYKMDINLLLPSVKTNIKAWTSIVKTRRAPSTGLFSQQTRHSAWRGWGAVHMSSWMQTSTTKWLRGCVQVVLIREMEYIESSYYNTFYPFQNKHQIHWHLQSVNMLSAFKNQNHEMGQANQ